jgi:hypothetical protein
MKIPKQDIWVTIWYLFKFNLNQTSYAFPLTLTKVIKWHLKIGTPPFQRNFRMPHLVFRWKELKLVYCINYEMSAQ